MKPSNHGALINKILLSEEQVGNICEAAKQKIFAEVLDHAKQFPNSPWSGAPLVKLEKTIKSLYSDWGIELKGEFQKSLPATMRDFYTAAAKEMYSSGMVSNITGVPDPGRIKYFLTGAYDQIAMKTDKMSFDHVKALRQLSAEVFRTASLTGDTRAEVSRALLAKATDIPGFQFRNKDGSVWSNKAYFKMLARTELMNAGRASYEDKCVEEGYDVMLLSVSGDPCERCASFEGKLFSLSGATPGLPTKDDLLAAGVFHPNCTHSYSAVPDYVIEEDFKEDGTPKKPLGEAGPKEKQPSKPKNVIPASAPDREEQFASYDAVRDDFYQRAVKAGAGKEAASELADLYTPKMSAMGPPPRNIVVSKKELPSWTQSADMLTLRPAGDPLYDNAHVIRHEMGHWWQYRAQAHDGTLSSRIEAAGHEDWKRLLGDAEENGYVKMLDRDIDAEMASGASGLQNYRFWCKNLFRIDTTSVPDDEMRQIINLFDSIGSISGGAHGGGHGWGRDHGRSGARRYYSAQNQRLIFGEAVANIHDAIKSGDARFKLVFPNLWNILEQEI